MATADKLTYLNETKNQIKKAIESENLVAIDDTTTFREYAEKIKSTNEEIKKYIPTDSQSGISLQVTNAVPLNIKKGVIDGNSYQYTTKGNQLFDFANARAVGGGVTWSFDNDVLSISSIAGTTGYKSIQIDITDLCKENKGKSLNFTDNGYSVEDISLNPMVQITVKYSDGTSNFYRSLRNYRHNTSDKYTIPEDMTNISSVICGIYSNNTSNAVANNLIIQKPLLYFDDNNEYEPYTGGKVSPSPDYPQGIEVVSGKNIIGLGTPIDGYTQITNSGKWIPTTSGLTYYFETSKLPDEVIISGDGNRSNVSYFNSIPTTNGQIADKYETTNYQYMPRSFKVDKNYKYIFIQVYYDAYGVGELTLQLEKGSIATEIVPFNNLQLTNSGKNKFNIDTITIGKVVNDQGEVVNSPAWNISDYIEVDNLNIVYSMYTEELTSKNTILAQFDKNKQFITRTASSTNKTERLETQLKLATNTKYVILGYRNDQNIFDIQLENENATEYEPYHKDEYLIDLQNNFLAKIGDVKDTLDLTSGVVNKNIKKIVLDGSENWTMIYGDGMFQFNAPIKTIAQKKAYSDHFIYNPVQASIYKSLKDGEFAIQLYSTNNTIFIKHMEFDNVADFKNWLSNNNVTIYYQVAEPETIQLDPINIKMYEGTNNIELDTNLETNMSIDYYKDYLLDSQEVEVSEE